jgi:hypothetical protein
MLSLLFKEFDQLGIHLFRMRPSDAVWTILHDVQAGAVDEFGGA